MRMGSKYGWRGVISVASIVFVIGVSVTAAQAHRPYIKANIVRFDGAPDGLVVVRPTGRGDLSMKLPSAPAGGILTFDYRLNAGPTRSAQYPAATDATWPLGFPTADQDKIEIIDLRLLDAGGSVVGAMGTGGTPHLLLKKVMAVPLIWVVDTQSDVGFTRGGDTVVTALGSWSVGFDALRSRTTRRRLDNAGNRAEIEVSINDGPWQVFSVTFDVVSGKSRPSGRPGRPLPFVPGDKVLVRRVDVFDPVGHRFATIGVRMGPQGHYSEDVPPPPTPTPTPEATATPTPEPTPEATPTPEPTPEATPTPDPTPEATPTPEPTPEPTPTPDPTPEATPTPEPTPEPTPTPET